ncbi:UDP-N-acetylglucosamine transferase subunit ALG13-like protein [Senna tora]|uniref:UDP-N-acetylglucosamine transferase subunit ALG13-like protein n=1 Tax=Senna tora TaxID=362788 RepID=A0A834T9T6_9FABA|nr:UDP-N-acetylglucosamine transferase subunit ALG13-like protein [Senna tora]
MAYYYESQDADITCSNFVSAFSLLGMCCGETDNEFHQFLFSGDATPVAKLINRFLGFPDD